MKQKEILLFGATGQIGRNLIRKLSKNNYKILAVTRNIHRAGYILKTQANPGYLELIELKNFQIDKIDSLIKKCSICINLIGILYEKKNGNTFKNIHTIFPTLLAKLCKQYDLESFIHLSALGINEAKDSKYAKTKLDGEKEIIRNFSKSIILRPSVVFSRSDNFTTQFMTLLNRLPIFPLYYSGETKFSPIHCSDLTDIIYYILSHDVNSQIIELLMSVLSIKDFEKISKTGKLSNQNIMFTGGFEKMSRSEAKALAEENGAKILGSVSKKLNYLVVGNSKPTKKKIEKAKELKIDLMTEDKWYDLLDR